VVCSHHCELGCGGSLLVSCHIACRLLCHAAAARCG
jgi:hypothetical protein